MMLLLLMGGCFVILFACILGMAVTIEHNASQADVRAAIAEDYVRGLDNDR